MKRFALAAMLIAGCAIAEDLPDEGIVISAAERRALVSKFMQMNQQIEDLQRKLHYLNEKLGCV